MSEAGDNIGREQAAEVRRQMTRQADKLAAEVEADETAAKTVARITDILAVAKAISEALDSDSKDIHLLREETVYDWRRFLPFFEGRRTVETPYADGWSLIQDVDATPRAYIGYSSRDDERSATGLLLASDGDVVHYAGRVNADVIYGRRETKFNSIAARTITALDTEVTPRGNPAYPFHERHPHELPTISYDLATVETSLGVLAARHRLNPDLF
jgi:hypothetical protein